MLFLQVPYSEKEAAKALGAKWNTEARSWYVPDGLDEQLFESWKSTKNQLNKAPVHSVMDNLEIDFTTDDNVITSTKENHLTLFDYMQQIESVIRVNFTSPQWVKLEISKVSSKNKHMYFDFVEYDESGKEKAKARGSLWASKKQAIVTKFEAANGSTLQEGMKILALIKADFNPNYGMGFVIEDIDPNFTLGDMQAKIKAIRDELIRLKLYDANKNLPSAFDFNRIAVVSPEGAAGLADFMMEANALQSFTLCQFDYFTAIFQGKNASESIVKALNSVNNAHVNNQYDALVIIRGGGASADLAWLNDLSLLKILCLMPMPALAGIGHQIDHTLVDEVSNLAFDTPSKVSGYIAGTIIRNAKEVMSMMASIRNDAVKSVMITESAIESRIYEVKSLAVSAISQKEIELNALVAQIKTNTQNFIISTDQHLQYMMSEVIGLSPKNTLSRGYAVVRDRTGRILSSAEKANACKLIEIEFKDGKIPAKLN